MPKEIFIHTHLKVDRTIFRGPEDEILAFFRLYGWWSTENTTLNNINNKDRCARQLTRPLAKKAGKGWGEEEDIFPNSAICNLWIAYKSSQERQLVKAKFQ